jgi:hypothetical protein
VQGYLLGRPTADPKVLLKHSQASAACDKTVSSDSLHTGESIVGSECGSRMRAQKAGNSS